MNDIYIHLAYSLQSKKEVESRRLRGKLVIVILPAYPKLNETSDLTWKPREALCLPSKTHVDESRLHLPIVPSAQSHSLPFDMLGIVTTSFRVMKHLILFNDQPTETDHFAF